MISLSKYFLSISCVQHAVCGTGARDGIVTLPLKVPPYRGRHNALLIAKQWAKAGITEYGQSDSGRNGFYLGVGRWVERALQRI